eukprot:38468-Rhodomonas_salina.2
MKGQVVTIQPDQRSVLLVPSGGEDCPTNIGGDAWAPRLPPLSCAKSLTGNSVSRVRRPTRWVGPARRKPSLMRERVVDHPSVSRPELYQEVHVSGSGVSHVSTGPRVE